MLVARSRSGVARTATRRLPTYQSAGPRTPLGLPRPQQAERLPRPSSPWPDTHLARPSIQARSFVFAAVRSFFRLSGNSAARRRLGAFYRSVARLTLGSNRQLRNIEQERDAPRPADGGNISPFSTLREREIRPACPNQRLLIQLGTIDALANGFHAVAIAKCATCRDPAPSRHSSSSISTAIEQSENSSRGESTPEGLLRSECFAPRSERPSRSAAH